MPSEKFSAQEHDGGAADAMFVKALRVASDDHGHRAAATGKTFGFQGGGHGGDVGVEALLSDQRTG